MNPDIIDRPIKRIPRPMITEPTRLVMRRAFHSDSPKPTAVST